MAFPDSNSVLDKFPSARILSQTSIRKEFPQRGRIIAISFAKPFAFASNSFATLNSQLFL